jgi:hypothetical protein
MPSTYDIGDIIRATGTFTDTGGVVSDPATVGFLYDTPTSTAPTTATRTSTSTGAVSGIVKESTGVYYLDIATTGSGLYEWRFTSTGTVSASGESWASVRPRRVTT